MFKLLLGMRLRMFLYSLSGRSKKDGDGGYDKRKLRGGLALIVLMSVMMAGMFTLSFVQVAGVLIGGEHEDLFFALSFVSAFLFSFMGSALTAQQQLFGSDDNELLLAMPIKPSVIIASRAAVLYVVNAAYCALALAPSFVIYCVYGTPGAAQIVLFALALFLFPLHSLFFSVALGYLLALITRRSSKKNVITTVFSMIMTIVYVLFCQRLPQIMQAVAVDPQKTGDIVKKVFYPIWLCSRPIATAGALDALVAVALELIPIAVTWALISRSFIAIVTTPDVKKQKQFRGARYVLSSQRSALVKKEIAHCFGSVFVFLNAGMGCILSPIAAAVLAFGAKDMFTAQDAERFIPVAIVCAVCMFSLMNTFSACSVSIDAKNIQTIKSMPIETKSILSSKALAHIAVCAPFELLSSVVGLAASLIRGYEISPSFVIALFVCPQLCGVFCAWFGLRMNTAFPKTVWQTEAEAAKQSLSVMLGVFVPLLAALPCGGVAFGLIIAGEELPIPSGPVSLAFFLVYIGALTLLFYKLSLGKKSVAAYEALD